MAYTPSAFSPTVFGNARAAFGTITIASAVNDTATGLDYVYGGAITPLTVTTGGYGSNFNVTAGGITVYSASTGDTFNYLVFGR